MRNKLKLGHVLATCLVLSAMWGRPSAAQETPPPALAPALAGQLPADSRVMAVKKKVIDGKEYNFVKFRDAQGAAAARAFSPAMQQIGEENVPIARPRVIGSKLASIIDVTQEPGAVVRVNVALRAETVDDLGLPISGNAGFGRLEGDEAPKILQAPQFMLQGRPADAAQVQAAIKQRAASFAARTAANTQRMRQRINTLADRQGWAKRPEVARAAVEQNRSTIAIDLTHREISELLDENRDLISGIELYVEPTDDVDSAMKSSRVDPYAIDYTGRKGKGVGIYFTESGAPNPGHITNYKKLAGNRTNHSENVSGIMRAVSPESFIYGRGGAVLPTNTDLNGYDGKPPIHVINRSNSWGDTDDYTVTDRDWDNFVYNKAVASFNSAGNTGNANGYCKSPAKGLNIITIGNYNDANNTIASSSSYKNAETGNNKPELSAPGVNVTAGGHTMSGTSMSSPHATAFSADLMSAFPWLKSKPFLVKGLMMAGGTKSISGGTDKVGAGGADFASAYYSFWSYWWMGGNSAFSGWDAGDAFPNNGYVDAQHTLNAATANVRVVLTWLNRGTYTYDHRSDAHPIGTDLDLIVYDPNGTVVASSGSWDNPYEMVNFDPQVTGKYRFAIRRYANRDTQSKLHIALVINW